MLLKLVFSGLEIKYLKFWKGKRKRRQKIKMLILMRIIRLV